MHSKRVIHGCPRVGKQGYVSAHNAEWLLLRKYPARAPGSSGSLKAPSSHRSTNTAVTTDRRFSRIAARIASGALSIRTLRNGVSRRILLDSSCIAFFSFVPCWTEPDVAHPPGFVPVQPRACPSRSDKLSNQVIRPSRCLYFSRDGKRDLICVWTLVVPCMEQIPPNARQFPMQVSGRQTTPGSEPCSFRPLTS